MRNTDTTRFTSLLRLPSALLPLIMSFAALSLIVLVLVFIGMQRQPGEGAPARLFQLLIVLQIPIVAFFALKWLPRSPRPALQILLLQCGAAAVASMTIMLIEHSAGT